MTDNEFLDLKREEQSSVMKMQIGGAPQCCRDYRCDSYARAEALRAQLDAVLEDVEELKQVLRYTQPSQLFLQSVSNAHTILDRALARKIGDKT